MGPLTDDTNLYHWAVELELALPILFGYCSLFSLF